MAVDSFEHHERHSYCAWYRMPACVCVLTCSRGHTESKPGFKEKKKGTVNRDSKKKRKERSKKMMHADKGCILHPCYPPPCVAVCMLASAKKERKLLIRTANACNSACT